MISVDGAAEVAPMLAPELVAGTDKIPGFAGVISRWEPLCNKVEVRFGLPHGYLLATVWRESGGDEKAFRREPNGWTGIGLTQPTSPGVKEGYSDHDLWDPEKNLSCGARYLAKQIARYGKDAPKVFAAYNAGSVVPTEANPWGMVQTAGHVSAEVAALNYYLMLDWKIAAEQAAALQFGELDLIGDDFDRVTLPDEDEVAEGAPPTVPTGGKTS